jgi:hypothetical protein
VRALLRRVWALRNDASFWRGVALAGAVYGAKHLCEETFSRLEELEKKFEKGATQLDDIATVADIEKLRSELTDQIAGAGGRAEGS